MLDISYNNTNPFKIQFDDQCSRGQPLSSPQIVINLTPQTVTNKFLGYSLLISLSICNNTDQVQGLTVASNGLERHEKVVCCLQFLAGYLTRLPGYFLECFQSQLECFSFQVAYSIH